MRLLVPDVVRLLELKSLAPSLIVAVASQWLTALALEAISVVYAEST